MPLSAIANMDYLEDKQEIKQFYHKKHSYIHFNGKGVVHDPDCACNMKMIGAMVYYTDGVDIYLERDWSGDK